MTQQSHDAFADREAENVAKSTYDSVMQGDTGPYLILEIVKNTKKINQALITQMVLPGPVNLVTRS